MIVFLLLRRSTRLVVMGPSGLGVDEHYGWALATFFWLFLEHHLSTDCRYSRYVELYFLSRPVYKVLSPGTYLTELTTTYMLEPQPPY